MTGSKNKEEYWTLAWDYDNNIYSHHWDIIFTNDMKKHLKDTLIEKGATEKEIKRQLPTRDTVAQVNVIRLKNKKAFNVVLFDITKYSSNTGVHEAFHMVKEMLYPRGLRLDNSGSSEEPWAYLLGNVYQNIESAYKHSLVKYKAFKKELKNGTTGTNN